jgi:hypothetical protein
MTDIFYDLVKKGDIEALRESLETDPSSYLSMAVSAAITTERVDMLELLLAQPRAHQRGAFIGRVEERSALLSRSPAMIAFVLDQRGSRANLDNLFENAVRSRQVPAARVLRERVSKKRLSVLMLNEDFARDLEYIETASPDRSDNALKRALESTKNCIKASIKCVGESLGKVCTRVGDAYTNLFHRRFVNV